MQCETIVNAANDLHDTGESRKMKLLFECEI